MASIARTRREPAFMLEEKLHDTAFDVHTYKHTTMGFEADVKNMPKAIDYSRTFFHRFYRPENVVLLVVGDFEPAAVMKLIEEYYGAWKPGYAPAKIKPEPPQTRRAQGRGRLSRQDAADPRPGLSRRRPSIPTNRDYVAARLLAELAFGETSHALQETGPRPAEGRDDLGAACPSAATPGSSRSRPSSNAKRISKTFVGKSTARSKSFKRTRSIRPNWPAGETPREILASDGDGFAGRRGAGLAPFVGVTGGIEAMDRFYAAADQVTPEDVMQAARKYFDPKQANRGCLERNPAVKYATTISGRPDGSFRGDLGRAAERPSCCRSRNACCCRCRPIRRFPSAFGSRSVRRTIRRARRGWPPLTAAMLTEGSTKQHGYEAILDRLFPLAGGYSASTSVEMTVISGRIHKDNLAEYYPLLMQAVLSPAFRQQDLDRIKGQMIDYLENGFRYSSDEELGKSVLYETIFAGTGYGHIPAGRIQSLHSITLDDVRKFYREHFTRDNVVLGLGGGYDAGSAPSNPRRPRHDCRPGVARQACRSPEPQPIQGLHVTIVEKDAPATAISIGFQFDVLRGQPDWYPLAVANSWLGEHRHSASHLYQFIRELRGLNYGDYSYIEHFANGDSLQFPQPNDARRQQIFEIWLRALCRTRCDCSPCGGLARVPASGRITG